MIKSKIDRYNTSERKMAEDMILEMIATSSMKELIFDIGYPSSELIAKLIENNVYFLMRLSSKTFKTLIKADEQDQIIDIKYKNKLYTARVIRFFLDLGVEEILITNLFDESFKIQDFKELYFKRWGVMLIFL